jgi:hypothetical protein
MAKNDFQKSVDELALRRAKKLQSTYLPYEQLRELRDRLLLPYEQLRELRDRLPSWKRLVTRLATLFVWLALGFLAGILLSLLLSLFVGCAAPALPFWTSQGDFDYSALQPPASAEDAQRACYVLDTEAHSELMDEEHLQLISATEIEWALILDHTAVEPWPKPSGKIVNVLPYRCMKQN